MSSTSMPHRSASRARSAMAHGAWTWAPNGREHADPPVADLVAEALDHDRAVVGHGAGGLGLLVQVAEQVRGRPAVEVVARRAAARRASASGRARISRTNSPSAAPSSSGRPGPVAVPERHLAGLARAPGVTTTRSWVMSSMRQVDAPSRNVSPGRDS